MRLQQFKKRTRNNPRVQLGAWRPGRFSMLRFITGLVVNLSSIRVVVTILTVLSQIILISNLVTIIPAQAATTDLGRQIPVTARMIDPGTRIPVADGTYSVRYAIYSINRTTADAFPSDADAGSRLWSETKDIQVTNGILFSYLGSSTALPATLDFSSNSLFLGIRINTDPELVPRRKLGQVPGAISADNLQGKIPGFGTDQIPYTDASGTLALTNGLSVSSTPVATASAALLQLGSSFTGGSASGTYVGANASLGFSGNLVDLKVNGSSKFTIDATGQITAGSLAPGVLGSSVVTSFAKTGSAARTGAISLTQGSNMTITDNGDGTYTLAVSAGGGSVTSVGSGAGLTGGPITTSGTLSVDPSVIPFLANTQIFTGTTNSFTSANTSGVTTSSSVAVNANSLTSGTGLYVASSSLTSGKAVDIQVNSTGAASNTQTGLNVNTQGANGTSSQTSYGSIITNTHTGTTSTNIGGYFAASGATNNYGLIVNGGNVGIGDASPVSLFTVGSGDLFQVNSSGAIAAAAGIASSGTIAFSGLSTNGPIYTSGGTGTLNSEANLSVVRGGTGAGTFTANGVLYGNTTSALGVTAAGTTGQCLIATTAAAPSWGSCAGSGSGVTLQAAYNNGATITTVDGTPVAITAANTSGNGFSVASSTLTTGNAASFTSTSTAAGSNTQTVLNIATSGANGTSTQTTYGAQVANTHTGTSSTNVAGYFTASGGSNNYAGIFAAGNVGIGDTTPTALLTVGSGDLFQVSSGGAVAAATGIASSGTIAFSGLSTNGPVYTSGGTGTLNSEATLAVVRGGTNIASYSIGDILYASGATTLASLADVAVNQVLVSGGVGAAPTYSASPTLTALTAGTINATTALQLSGVSINTGGTLSNVAYLNASNTFTGTTNTFTLPVTTGTDGTSGLSVTANSLTTGNGVDIATSSVTTGNLVKLSSTSTAAGSNTQTVLSVATSGTNGTSAQTTYAFQAANTHAGTTSTNVAGYFTASGGTTANYGLQVAAGQVVVDTAGALSAPAIYADGTWITGGTSTTNKPYLLVEPSGTSSTNWNTNGTGIGVNAASGFAGSLLDLKVANSSKFTVEKDGVITQTLVTNGAGYESNNAGSGTGVQVQISNNATKTHTSGTVSTVGGGDTFTVSSGTGALDDFLSRGTINQTSTATGIVKGFSVGNTLTSTYDFRGFDSTYTISGALASSTAYGVNIAITNNQATNANTVYGQKIGFTDAGSLANTVYGNYVDVTTANASDTTYAIITQGGNVGIGDTTPTALLTVGNGDLFQVNSSGAIAAVVGITSSSDYVQSTGKFQLTSNVSSGTGTSAGLSLAANSLTSGNGIDVSSSSVTSGNLVKITSTSTAAASNTLKGLNIAISGANASTAQTVYGQYTAVTNTNGTSGTNIAGYFSATGATTDNIALDLVGHVRITQGTAPTIGTPTSCGTSPTASITAGSTDTAGQLTINSGSGTPGTCTVVVTFNTPFAAAPKSIITTWATLGQKTHHVTQTNTTFTVTFDAVHVASVVYTLNYLVIE